VSGDVDGAREAPGPVIGLGEAHRQVTHLRRQIEEIASTLAPCALPTGPEFIEDNCRVWHDGRSVRVHTTDGSVFMAGKEYGFEFWPDWTCLSRSEAREIGVALLAAAADVPAPTAEETAAVERLTPHRSGPRRLP
jgi:hypothetical protein